MKTIFAAALFACAVAASAAGLAQHTGHGQHGTAGEAKAAPTNSNEAFEAANARMHMDMAIELSGDTDADFVRGMIPHHQGAIDMARIVLQYGKDAEIKELAEEIIAAQEKEIAWMQDWLAKNGK
jgi:uncharacterized protein (DUF305 family)